MASTRPGHGANGWPGPSGPAQGRPSRIDPAVVSRLLGRWTTSDTMLSSALANRLAALIGRGELPHGAWLPSQRQLSEALGVSRVTVGNAYEILRAHGILDGAARVHRRAAVEE